MGARRECSERERRMVNGVDGNGDDLIGDEERSWASPGVELTLVELDCEGV